MPGTLLPFPTHIGDATNQRRVQAFLPPNVPHLPVNPVTNTMNNNALNGSANEWDVEPAETNRETQNSGEPNSTAATQSDSMFYNGAGFDPAGDLMASKILYQYQQHQQQMQVSGSDFLRAASQPNFGNDSFVRSMSPVSPGSTPSIASPVLQYAGSTTQLSGVNQAQANSSNEAIPANFENAMGSMPNAGNYSKSFVHASEDNSSVISDEASATDTGLDAAKNMSGSMSPTTTSHVLTRSAAAAAAQEAEREERKALQLKAALEARNEAQRLRRRTQQGRKPGVGNRRRRTGPIAEVLEPAPGQTRYWTAEEHRKFLIATAKYGEKAYVAISNFVKSRTPKQVRTHAQKYQMKMARIAKKQAKEAEELAKAQEKSRQQRLQSRARTRSQTRSHEKKKVFTDAQGVMETESLNDDEPIMPAKAVQEESPEEAQKEAITIADEEESPMAMEVDTGGEQSPEPQSQFSVLNENSSESSDFHQQGLELDNVDLQDAFGVYPSTSDPLDPYTSYLGGPPTPKELLFDSFPGKPEESVKELPILLGQSDSESQEFTKLKKDLDDLEGHSGFSRTPFDSPEESWLNPKRLDSSSATNKHDDKDSSSDDGSDDGGDNGFASESLL